MRFQIAARKLMLVLPLLAGCGGGENPFDYVPVSGSVKFADGAPLAVGKVVFESEAPPIGMAHPRPGSTNLDANGQFAAVTTYKPDDGLIPGKHKVAIMFAVDAKGKSLVPKAYTSMATTPLVIDTADTPLVIEIPRP